MNKNKIKQIGKDLLTMFIVVIITLLFSKYIVGLTSVIGNSMNDTYQNGDFLLTEKFSKNCKRFDVITFDTNFDGVYIKRVIGLPGETVRIDTDGNIYINDILLEESYGKETIKDPGLAINEITLGEDEYFVLGDNRNNSYDSRFEKLGPVNKEDIIGIILFSK